MERLPIKALLRENTGKGVARKLRARGLIPAILYGRSSQPQPLSVDPMVLEKTLAKAGGANALLDLELEGQGRFPVMVKEFQADVLKRNFLHIDFIKVDLTQKIVVEIPIHLTGKAIGVKDAGGILEHIHRTLEVECLPTAIPEFLELDVSALNVGDSLHARDIKLPEGVEIHENPDTAIVAVVEPTEEKAPVAAEGAAPAEPEVIGKKKDDEAEDKEKEKDTKKGK